MAGFSDVAEATNTMAGFSDDGVDDDAAEDLSFTIACSDGALAVPASDATKLIARCHFFRAAFAHGTTEDADRIVRKPDWLLSTAHRVRTFFVTESVQIDPFACADVTAFAEAMDQLLVSDLVVIVPNSTDSSRPALAEFVSALVLQTRPSWYAFDLGMASVGSGHVRVLKRFPYG